MKKLTIIGMVLFLCLQVKAQIVSIDTTVNNNYWACYLKYGAMKKDKIDFSGGVSYLNIERVVNRYYTNFEMTDSHIYFTFNDTTFCVAYRSESKTLTAYDSSGAVFYSTKFKFKH